MPSLDPPDCPLRTWISTSTLQIRLRDSPSPSRWSMAKPGQNTDLQGSEVPHPTELTASLSGPGSPVTDQGGGDPDESQGRRGSGRRRHQGWAFLKDRRMELKQRRGEERLGRGVLGGLPRDEGTGRDSRDVLRKLLGRVPGNCGVRRGSPLPCEYWLPPTPPTTLGPSHLPEQRLPCQVLGLLKGRQLTGGGPACASGRPHSLVGAAKGPPRNTGLRMLEFRGETVQKHRVWTGTCVGDQAQWALPRVQPPAPFHMGPLPRCSS